MISLVVPVFNSAPYIDAHLTKLSEYLQNNFPDFEIVAVDDGSTDNTAAVLDACAQENGHVRALKLPYNQGKGAAVKAGVMASRGEYIVFTDADLPYDLPAIPAFVEKLKSGYDVVLGARQDNGEVNGQKLHRTFLSRLFAACANLSLRERVPDTQAGIKGFTARAAKEIFERVTIPRFGFDVEVIAIAQKHAMNIASVPVRLVNQAPSTVRVGSDGLQMCLDIAYVFFKYRL